MKKFNKVDIVNSSTDLTKLLNEVQTSMLILHKTKESDDCILHLQKDFECDSVDRYTSVIFVGIKGNIPYYIVYNECMIALVPYFITDDNLDLSDRSFIQRFSIQHLTRICNQKEEDIISKGELFEVIENIKTPEEYYTILYYLNNWKSNIESVTLKEYCDKLFEALARKEEKDNILDNTYTMDPDNLRVEDDILYNNDFFKFKQISTR